MAKSYDYNFRLTVVQDALRPENLNSNDFIAEKYGISPRTLRGWIRRYKLYGEDGLKPNFNSELKDKRIKELERENAELREEAEILKKAAAFLADAMRK